jgi:hypothetical protein
MLRLPHLNLIASWFPQPCLKKIVRWSMIKDCKSQYLLIRITELPLCNISYKSKTYWTQLVFLMRKSFLTQLTYYITTWNMNPSCRMSMVRLGISHHSRLERVILTLTRLGLIWPKWISFGNFTIFNLKYKQITRFL